METSKSQVALTHWRIAPSSLVRLICFPFLGNSTVMTSRARYVLCMWR